jgi:lysophospholipase L1-like esterase
VRLAAAQIALGPLLIWQGLRVRARALRLPEAAGPRERAGDGLRLLIVGDSSGAGVGASHQDQALAGQLECQLAPRFGPVGWQLVATTGHRSDQALEQLRATPLRPADVLVTALGVNDVVDLRAPRRSVAALQALIADARERAGVRQVLISAAPPMHRFPLLPQPLRWFMGERALQLNAALQAAFGEAVIQLPASLQAEAGSLLAEDGFHPNPAGYRLWAETLAAHLGISRDLPWSSMAT